jgi:hypothetical protein
LRDTIDDYLLPRLPYRADIKLYSLLPLHPSLPCLCMVVGGPEIFAANMLELHTVVLRDHTYLQATFGSEDDTVLYLGCTPKH